MANTTFAGSVAPSPVFYVAGMAAGGVALLAGVSEPLLHHARLSDCNPRVELCRVADLTWLPDDRERHSRSQIPSNALLVMATSTANSTALLSSTGITAVRGAGALKITVS